MPRTAFAGINDKLCHWLTQELAHRLPRHFVSYIESVDINYFAGVLLDFGRPNFPFLVLWMIGRGYHVYQSTLLGKESLKSWPDSPEFIGFRDLKHLNGGPFYLCRKYLQNRPSIANFFVSFTRLKR